MRRRPVLSIGLAWRAAGTDLAAAADLSESQAPQDGGQAPVRGVAASVAAPDCGDGLPVGAAVRVALGRGFDDSKRCDARVVRAAAPGLPRGEHVVVEAHVTAKVLDGLNSMIGQEERRLRRDPLTAGSALRRMFGSGR